MLHLSFFLMIHHLLIHFNYFLSSSSEDDCGFVPVPRRFDILFNRSNQNGAPIKIARIVASNPVIFVITTPTVIAVFVLLFQPRGMSLVNAAFASLIFCRLLFISPLIC